MLLFSRLFCRLLNIIIDPADHPLKGIGQTFQFVVEPELIRAGIVMTALIGIDLSGQCLDRINNIDPQAYRQKDRKDHEQKDHDVPDVLHSIFNNFVHAGKTDIRFDHQSRFPVRTDNRAPDGK